MLVCGRHLLEGARQLALRVLRRARLAHRDQLPAGQTDLEFARGPALLHLAQQADLALERLGVQACELQLARRRLLSLLALRLLDAGGLSRACCLRLRLDLLGNHGVRSRLDVLSGRGSRSNALHWGLGYLEWRFITV